MAIKDLKYLLAYLTPLTVWISLTFTGIWSYLTLIFVFVLIPILDLLLPKYQRNYDVNEEGSRSSNILFDLLLYLNIPILFALIYLFFNSISGSGLLELIGRMSAVGILIGTIGINVAHELGHRSEWYHQWMSRLLLMTGLYMHFNIEHNKGHHLNVATPMDPATAQKGDSFYHFWWKSVTGSYQNAWKINNKELSEVNSSFFRVENLMLWFHLWQALYLGIIFIYFGWIGLCTAIIVAWMGFSLLEAVNYIEHYGLLRKQNASGRFEAVALWHSWNSNHELGRILLYELTRHSDHHYKSKRKYQVLRHFDESPQLPYGYPGSILIALFPKMWFRTMDKYIV